MRFCRYYPPKITLIGDPAASVCQCCTYTDAGYSLSDNFDSTKYIIIEQEGSFKGNSKLEGIYSLRYKATDRAGNFAYSKYRYIMVRNKDEFPCADKHCCVGIEENDFSANLNIYPNPAQEELFIETNLFVNSVVIYSISGQKISEIRISQNLNLPYKIDTKHFPAGIYMVQVKTASGIIHKKVQISR
ncbi:MAG: T9SS type A sorting domain-containing protein [Bacteroidia bacterium]